MASELRFETKVDLSGLNQGMAGATATVKSGSQQMTAALVAARLATSDLSKAFTQFGAAAKEGNAEAVAILTVMVERF